MNSAEYNSRGDEVEKGQTVHPYLHFEVSEHFFFKIPYILDFPHKSACMFVTSTTTTTKTLVFF